jgi:glycosyltransferase involved in cell wall biosynthesis
VLKGVWPGIGRDDRVLLWAGGVWKWLDAITPIRAVERLREGGRRVHLVFLGTGRPRIAGADVPTSADAAIAFAAERGLEGVSVHFNRGWVPYEERQAYLLEADIGVCAHHDHLEARYSFRTRVLDHFWAGLPSVVSSGDAIGDLVDREGLGYAVEPGDDGGFALACGNLLDDADAHAAAARRVRELAPSLRWSEVARPLVRFCVEAPTRPARRPARSALARATYGQYPDILSDLRERGGVGAVARRVPHHVARLLRHRA